MFQSGDSRARGKHPAGKNHHRLTFRLIFFIRIANIPYFQKGSCFGRRFGRVYLRVGEPILASEVLGERAEPWRSLDREQRKEVLQRTGERLVHRIAENTVVLPTSIVSMALLAQSRRGMRVGQLKARADRLLALLRRAGAQTAHSLQHTSWAVEEALERLERARDALEEMV